MRRGWSRLIAAVTSPGELVRWPRDQRPLWMQTLRWTGTVLLWLFAAMSILSFAGLIIVMVAFMKAMVQILRKYKH